MRRFLVKMEAPVPTALTNIRACVFPVIQATTAKFRLFAPVIFWRSVVSFFFSLTLYLDISVLPVDSDTRLSVLSAKISVFVVNAESVYPLITNVSVDSILGIAEVEISFEATLLLLVQAPDYSTVSRSYYSYCSPGT